MNRFITIRDYRANDLLINVAGIDIVMPVLSGEEPSNMADINSLVVVNGRDIYSTYTYLEILHIMRTEG